jgi:hypothetical protein
MNTATITVAGIQINVEVLDGEHVKVIGRVAHSPSLPVAEWPITPAEYETRAQKVFDQYRCRPDRKDVVWAVNKAGDSIDETGQFLVFGRAIATKEEGIQIAEVARAEMADGLS